MALVDARKLDFYHALEAEHAGLVLVEAALEGRPCRRSVLDEDELDRALSAPRTGTTPPSLAKPSKRSKKA